MTLVVFVLAPDLHVLDLAGPAQVFSTAAEHGLPYALHYVADTPTVTTAQGVSLSAQPEWPDTSSADIVIVPGWHVGGRSAISPFSSATLEHIRAHHRRGGLVASVCSGAEALGRAGLLDGRRCTTHHELQDRLAARYPRAQVIRDVLFTQDDRVVTSAGIASGIDLSLHLLAERHGPAAAARVARSMVVYARRNGHAAQLSPMLRHRGHLNDAVHRVQDLIDTHFDQPLPLADLAALVGVSERTLSRCFTAATGITPLQYQQTIRTERAERLILQGATAESAARSVGFADARMLRRLRSVPRTPVAQTSPGATGP